MAAFVGSGSSFKRSLYMHRRADFIQKAQSRRAIRVVKIASEENRADILTKQLSPRAYARLRHKLQNVRHGGSAAPSIAMHRVARRIAMHRVARR